MKYFPGKFTREKGLLQTSTEWNALAAVSPEVRLLTPEQLNRVEFILQYILENPTESISFEEANRLEVKKNDLLEIPVSSAPLCNAKGFAALANLKFN
jgi:hypothetical protein